MNNKINEQVTFFSDIAQGHIFAKEFFTFNYILSIQKNFKFNNVKVLFYSPSGEFLSIRDHKNLIFADEDFKQKKWIENNEIRKKIYADAFNKLTYFNVEPLLYKSSDYIESSSYDKSNYVLGLNKFHDSHFSLTCVFGINAYIEVVFYKTKQEGDFTDEEIQIIRDLCIYSSNSYKTYKKHEHSKIVANIQDKIIETGEKAFFIIDDFLHIIKYNKQALKILKNIMGDNIEEQMDYDLTNHWLYLILGTDKNITDDVRTKVIKDYTFKIYKHDMHYSNKIIDRYYWITISKNDFNSNVSVNVSSKLTKTEQKVAKLMYEGLTYNEIADELVVSYHTIKKHVQNIYTKCHVTRRHDLNKFLEKNKA